MPLLGLRAFEGRRGPRPGFTCDELIKSFRRHGRVAPTARELQVSDHAVHFALKGRPGSPGRCAQYAAEVAKQMRCGGKLGVRHQKKHPTLFTCDELIKSFRRHGTVAATARELQVTPNAVHLALKGPRLYPGRCAQHAAEVASRTRRGVR